MGTCRIEKKRERRLRMTLTIAARRRADHLRRIHRDGAVDCVCELSRTYFSKRTSGGCDCRKRRKGRPRVASGMCCIEERERIYEWRLEGRLLREVVRSGRDATEEPDARRWPSGRSGVAKTWVVEVRAIGRDGEPRGGWNEHARYRTEAGRDSALRGFRLNVQRYQIRNYVAGEEASYIGPRKEYRATPYAAYAGPSASGAATADLER